ncbi:helix-loop-helix protein delilah [Procambarus clarkii]|uniref:helix-loop-helix protein delilah n=1 Tax=Procambarus clarkii TaxID=6728 RepID=UPI001E674C24|nr:helix-loop-helix protein delilah-like [Procambarus clarkii]
MMERVGHQRAELDQQRPRRSSTTNSSSEEKYGLRPRTIIKRLQQERVRQEVPKRTVRPKARPAPLSKYRRKTANARERHRMKEINNAFESLRKVLPDVVEVEAASSSMTKITTLRLAVNYIRALSHVLEDESVDDISSLQSSLECSFQNSLQQSLERSFCKTIAPQEASVNSFRYEHFTPPFSQQFLLQASQFSSYYSNSNHSSTISSPSTVRGSLDSASDLEDLLSDDSCLLEDNLDVFHDIPTFSIPDPFDILLGAEKDTLVFTTELCSSL